MDMLKIDLKKVLVEYNLDTQEVAKWLFPQNVRPSAALNRVLTGDALLDSEQIAVLSIRLGVDINTLYTGLWKSSPSIDTLVLRKGAIEAVLNKTDWTLTIFEVGICVHTQGIIPKHVTMSSLIALIEEITRK